MQKWWFAFALLAGCAEQADDADRTTTPPVSADARPPGSAAADAASGLAGLYEGAAVDPPHQLCIVEEGAAARFGLVVWGANLHSCSGSGGVTREGDRLRLAMAGDSTCVITASITGATVTLPRTLPRGCDYYCGARATMANASFARRGSTRAEALRAKDLVGDPLCAG